MTVLYLAAGSLGLLAAMGIGAAGAMLTHGNVVGAAAVLTAILAAIVVAGVLYASLQPRHAGGVTR